MNLNTLSIKDIEDVRIIIKMKGKHYAITHNKDGEDDKQQKEEALELRKYFLMLLLETHAIVLPALEDIKSQEDDKT